MKIPAIPKLVLSLALAMAGMLSLAPDASAQACAVTVSLTTPGSFSTACFVPHNQVSFVTITGTWAGTAIIQRSDDGGASYRTQESTTVNNTYALPTRANDSRYRVLFGTFTSGTLAGTITYNVNNVAPLTIPNVAIGSVAYSSLGSNVSTGASTTLNGTDLFIFQTPFSATGIGVMIGATTGTNTVILSLYDSTGALIANTTVAGTTVGLGGITNGPQQIAFTGGPFTLQPGRYEVTLQMNGTTDKYRAIAASTFVDVTGWTLTGAAFGTQTPYISPPQTFTADKGPIVYLY